ncbi:hypothetical protein RM553_15290 [Zunongwangia sp. F363]|uniref:Uncharacterized protein n=1 Tax=Autumnicola tepida TaxID=3075595 RepID=A0ABU3CDU6_9FLAO|nr:hypothetical protein [Zunongwangia sp. F363]MDT0644200.1 hypothetical protein [Zunongwangia sp. F363]
MHTIIYFLSHHLQLKNVKSKNTLWLVFGLSLLTLASMEMGYLLGKLFYLVKHT